jgi:HD-GYP domain-containing protein (c-di-GMP phosphodiesterase class II)
MTQERIYRKPVTPEQAKNELLKCSGTQFDPDLVALFVEMIDKM